MTKHSLSNRTMAAAALAVVITTNHSARPYLCAEAFTNPQTSIGGNRASLNRAEHLKYANLEKSALFTPSGIHHGPQRTIAWPAATEQLQTADQQKPSRDSSAHPRESSTKQPQTFGLQEDSTLIASDETDAVNRHSAGDWWYNLRSLPQSSVLRDIRHPVVIMSVWGSAVSVMHRILQTTGHQLLANQMIIPHAAHAFLVSMLSLLLVFRTNSAYQRFQEGRKIWEDILNISRNFSRMITVYREEIGQQRLETLKSLVAVFPYLLRHHVRSSCLCKDDHEAIPDEFKLQLDEPLGGRRVVDTRYEGDKLAMQRMSESLPIECFVDKRDWPWSSFDGHDAAFVARSANRPLWVCDRIGQELMCIASSDRFTSRERLSMLGSIDKLTNTIGQCERIHQTSVPLNYARHALRALSIWLFTIPFALVKDLGLLTGPTTGMIAWLMFGVYQIGHMIEDPFQKSLRLSILCDSIRRDVLHKDLDGSVASQRDSAFYVAACDEEDPSESQSSGSNGHGVNVNAHAELDQFGLPMGDALPRLDLSSIFPQRVKASPLKAPIAVPETEHVWN